MLGSGRRFDPGDARRRQVEFVEQVRAFRRSVDAFQRLATRQGIRREIGAAEQRLTSSPPASDAAPAVELLTPRQREIAALIALGYTNQRIADALVLTPGTVANHVQHILERLDLRSRTQVAVWYSAQTATRARRDAL
jgi:DNA-binding NarL/FixJ family response regulator